MNSGKKFEENCIYGRTEKGNERQENAIIKWERGKNARDSYELWIFTNSNEDSLACTLNDVHCFGFNKESLWKPDLMGYLVFAYGSRFCAVASFLLFIFYSSLAYYVR